MLKERFIEAMVEEDVGRGDLFARIAESKPIRAYVLAKSDGVLAGQEYVDTLARMYGLELEWLFGDGERFRSGEKLLWISQEKKTKIHFSRIQYT